MSHDAAIDHYVDSIFARYRSALLDHANELREPKVEDVERAYKRLGYVIETLTAFAIGHSVGRVVEAMRRIDGELAEPMAQAIARVGVPLAPIRTLPPMRYLQDASQRPIVDAFGAQLDERLALAACHARILLRAVATVIRRFPHRVSAFANALAALSNDPCAAFGFADQLALGWRFFVALVTDTADPEPSSESGWLRGHALWTAWSRRMRGAPKETGSRDFILRVA